jgi:catechol 2,3-dioxygenase-like lactoylglutathione lyase family enzyme
MLQHASLEIRPDQVEASVAFWELLGFERVEAPPELAHYVTWVERGETQIHLLATERPTAPPLGHAAVVVDDFDAALTALAEAGHEFRESGAYWGARRAFASAPGGHRVELMAAPPPMGT